MKHWGCKRQIILICVFIQLFFYYCAQCAIIQKTAAKNWRAAAWWLEQSCPNEFGKGVWGSM
jgi:hypothetical protein